MTALLKPTDAMLSRGLARGLPAELYHKHPAISRSTAEKILRSPAHYQHALANPTEETDAMALGTRIHSALLEPETFWPSVVVWTGGRRASKEWDAFKARHDGKEIITVAEEMHLLQITEAFKAHPISEAMAGGEAESSLFWQCPRTGLERKARLDCYKDDIVFDLKSTWSAATEDFSQSIQKYRYYRQAAWYCDGFEAVLGRKPRRFVLVAVETKPPYGIHPFVLDNTYLEIGARDNARALDLIAHYTKLGEWPSYDPDPTVIFAPHGDEIIDEEGDQ